MKFLETLEVDMYDFSQANLNSENRIKLYDTKYQTCGGFKWKFKK